MNILRQLKSVKRNLSANQGIVLEVLIINDGSSDSTMDILDENHGILDYEVINLNENKGYGFVLRKGFLYAGENTYDWLISFDMDGQHEPQCLYKFTEPISKKEQLPPIVSGTRYKDSDLFRQNPWKDRFLVNTVISGILNVIGFSITDSFCGLKAYRVKDINRLDLRVDGYEMPIELWLRAKEEGLEIVEIPVSVIYKDRDEEIRNNPTKLESFLFRKGEERIGKYVKLINSLLEKPMGPGIDDFDGIFTKFYDSVSVIDKDNFERIRNAIYDEIKALNWGDS